MQKLRKYGVFTLALAMSASALIPTAAASPKANAILPAAASSATPQMVDMTTSWSQAQKLNQQVQSLGKQVARLQQHWRHQAQPQRDYSPRGPGGLNRDDHRQRHQPRPKA